ncbi:MAG: histidine phosphatase family protein [Bacteroidaceae bacterium]|nr:histidine phosphatase family protein [Bacteroidaceae bacterium]
MIELYIARHGQTEENVRRILQGQMPGHLTAEGIRQAEELRDRLRHHHFDLIFSSDLLRATATARIVAEPHGGQFREEPLLRERDFGIHTGGPYIKISRALDPSAETVEQVALRAQQFLEQIATLPASQATAPGPRAPIRVLAISHGLFLRILQGVYHGIPTHDVEKMDNAEVRLLPIRPGQHFSIQPQGETGGTAN